MKTLPLLLLLMAAPGQETPPSFIVIYADDLGWGDLACYGHPQIRTPNLDRMAAEGMRFTQFYSASPVCTPSRAALLTGRHAIRSGMSSAKRRVLFPNSKGGLPDAERTLPELLKARGYATAAVGKWHLGRLPEHAPARHGFDHFYGLPYSNDMDRLPKAPEGKPAWAQFNVPLLRNGEVLEQPADQTTLTKRYTEESLRWIREQGAKPFFLYLAHAMPHIPLFASEEFRGKSPRGLYGDVVEELDWSVGRILEALRAAGLDRRTLVVFSSDNGPWLIHKENGGSAGSLREGKGSTWEGGQRVPGIFWWPGTVPAGVVTKELGATLDLLPTFVSLAGATVPAELRLDGVDLSSLLRGREGGPRRTDFAYLRDEVPWAYRKGAWKIHVRSRTGYGKDPVEQHDPPLLFNLEEDPGEQVNRAAEHPPIVTQLLRELRSFEASLQPVENQLEK